MEQFVVATSYAPGHNFWPGTPFSWWVRGSLAFALVAGPQVAVLAFSLLKCRRAPCWQAFAIGMAATAAVYALWPQIIGLRFRDADMPWYTGLRWGDRARPWLLFAGIVGCALARMLKPAEPRGFPVISLPADDSPPAH